MLRYTLMRLGIFAGCLVVVWGLVRSGIAPRGLGDSNGMWIIMLALLVSAPISLVVLRKERDRASERIVQRVDRVKSSLEANRNQEDEAADEVARTDASRADVSRTDVPRTDASRAQGQTS